MNIGLDLDNTIVNCSPVFANIAGSWLNRDFREASRIEVRNSVRKFSGDNLWTKIQAEVYGPSYTDCRPHIGAVDVIKSIINNQKVQNVFIISHKTKFDSASGANDLRASAWNWLDDNLLGKASLPRENIVFCETLHDKIDQIKSYKCDVFLDDLETVLEALNGSVSHRVLFNNHINENSTITTTPVVTNWNSFHAFVKNLCA